MWIVSWTVFCFTCIYLTVGFKTRTLCCHCDCWRASCEVACRHKVLCTGEFSTTLTAVVLVVVAILPVFLDRSLVQCCFTSTETVGLLGTGAQDGHLDFHTAPELWDRSCCCPRTSVDILGTSWDQCRGMVQYCFMSTEARRLVRTNSPGRPPRLSHSSWTMSGIGAFGTSCI